MKKIFIYLFLPILLVGCITTPPPRPITNTEIFQSSFGKVWGATVAAFAEKTLPIESIDKESGLITTKMVRTRRGLEIAVIPATWALGNTRFTLNLFAKPAGNQSTSIQINTHIEVNKSGLLGTDGWRVVPSKGVLEQEILDSIKAKL